MPFIRSESCSFIWQPKVVRWYLRDISGQGRATPTRPHAHLDGGPETGQTYRVFEPATRTGLEAADERKLRQKPRFRARSIGRFTKSKPRFLVPHEVVRGAFFLAAALGLLVASIVHTDLHDGRWLGVCAFAGGFGNL